MRADQRLEIAVNLKEEKKHKRCKKGWIFNMYSRAAEWENFRSAEVELGFCLISGACFSCLDSLSEWKAFPVPGNQHQHCTKIMYISRWTEIDICMDTRPFWGIPNCSGQQGKKPCSRNDPGLWEEQWLADNDKPSSRTVVSHDSERQTPLTAKQDVGLLFALMCC